MAKIRAVTFFLDPPSWEKGLLIEYMAEAGSRLRQALSDLGILGNVWSIRLSLPPLPGGVDPVEVAQAAQEALDESGATFSAAVHLDAGDPRADLLPEALESPGVYGSLRLRDPGDAGRAAGILVAVSRRDPEEATRLAIDLTGRGLATPYYPMSSNVAGDEGIALALLYTGELLAGARAGRIAREARSVFEWALEQGRMIADRLGVGFLGLDLSPSPWMEMSVARVVEVLSGVPLPEPGSVAAVRRLNEEVWEAGRGLPTTGFNETMLPVAEDNVLKERTLEGRLRLRDLSMLTVGCLAGVDMAVIPGEYGVGVVRSLLADQLVVQRLKGMPLGMRLVVYDGAAPGSKVRLGKFGEVPVSSL